MASSPTWIRSRRDWRRVWEGSKNFIEGDKDESDDESPKRKKRDKAEDKDKKGKSKKDDGPN